MTWTQLASCFYHHSYRGNAIPHQFCASDTFRLMPDANDTGTDRNRNISSSPAFSRSECPPSLDALLFSLSLSLSLSHTHTHTRTHTHTHAHAHAHAHTHTHTHTRTRTRTHTHTHTHTLWKPIDCWTKGWEEIVKTWTDMRSDLFSLFYLRLFQSLFVLFCLDTLHWKQWLWNYFHSEIASKFHK